MKILLDPIVTADPDRCSTNIQFLTLVRRVLKEIPDVYFYWMLPTWITEKEFLATYPQDPRVKYLPYEQSYDRTKEYIAFPPELQKLIPFNGVLWDIDVLITVRAGIVPLMKMNMTTPRDALKGWVKEIWLIEEMPLMSFKKTVAKYPPDLVDPFTMTGYLLADKIWTGGYHEPPFMLSRAREIFTPTHVQTLRAKIKPFVSASLANFDLFSEERRFKKDKQPFVIAHVGRVEMANRIEEINKIMVNNFVMMGDKVKLIVCSQSSTMKVFDTKVITCLKPKREEFWKIAREQMHVMIKMSPEGGFNLSLFEPMMFGVPAILGREPWSEALMGPDYPFYVKTEAQAYAYCKMFYDDYEGMYAKYSSWYTSYFIPLFKKRMVEDNLYLMIMAEINRARGTPKLFAEKYPTLIGNSVIKMTEERYADKGEVHLMEACTLMAQDGTAPGLKPHVKETARYDRPLTFSMNFHQVRVALKGFFGWEDASIEVGHLKKPDAAALPAAKLKPKFLKKAQI